MQKKSLLVALFCGALCLTGCLKNEESASVAQVRIAKANELNSIADLNKAKAQAELIYANAEATIAQAEAKLREANAALVLAQAETEKVRAELLKVRVQLMQVVVDEEKVRLQMLEADLEQKLAEVEAAVAKAESEKAKWIKDLENNIAQAEIQAVNNAKALLKAEAEMADYMLQLEGYKAEQARAASVKYFAALAQVQTLQTQKIQTLATKALVEAGAKEIRTVIYDAIDNIDEEIAKKEALVENLKKYQKMTPEQVEEAMVAARTQLEEVYNAYQTAAQAVVDAEAVYTRLNGEQSLFEADWANNFTDYVTNNWGRTYTWRDWWGRQRRYYVSYVTTESFADYGEDYPKVEYYGYGDRTDPTQFIKLWKYEPNAILTRDVLYPENVTVAKQFNYVQEGVIAPAEIFYDNIDVVLDSILNRKKAELAKDVKAAEAASTQSVEIWNETIDDAKEELKLIQKYVDARKDTVDRAETALDSLVEAANRGEVAEGSAQKAYYEYMLVKYNVSRALFEAEIDAAKDTVEVSRTYYAAKSAYDGAAASLPGLKTAKDNKATAIVDAKDDYDEAVRIAELVWDDDDQAAYDKAKKDWNPLFPETYTKVSATNPHKAASPFTNYNWFDTNKDSTGISQYNWLEATDNEENALKDWNDAKAALAKDPTNPTLIQEEADAHKDYLEKSGVTIDKTSEMRIDQITFEGEQAKYDLVWSEVETLKKKYNPDFATNHYNDGEVHYDKTDEVWYKGTGKDKKIAGSAQAAWFMADSVYTYTKHQVEDEGSSTDKTFLYKMKQAYKAYKGAEPKGKWVIWNDAFKALCEALKVAQDKYKADPMVAQLYNAWQEERKKPAADWSAKLEELRALYNIAAPDTPYTANPVYSWYVSNYHLNPEYEFVKNVEPDPTTGKLVIVKETVAKFLFNDDTDQSYTAIVASLTQAIADEPERLKEEIADIEAGLDVTAKEVADIRAALKQYKAYEADYKSWVSDRESAFKAWNEAKKVKIDAKEAYDMAQEIYDGLKIVAEGYMWVYDPDAKLYMEVYDKTSKPAADDPGKWEDGFTKVNVNDAIEMIETGSKELKDVVKAFRGVAAEVVKDAKDLRIDDKDINSIINKIERVHTKGLFDNIAGLNLIKKVLQETLTQGKVVLQTILEAFDAEIAELEEKIALQNKIAEIYKAVMYGYLGIVEEEDNDDDDEE